MRNFNDTFTQLLAAWNAHQDLRSHGASSGELYHSRTRLDNLRAEAALQRMSR